MTNSQ